MLVDGGQDLGFLLALVVQDFQQVMHGRHSPEHGVPLIHQIHRLRLLYVPGSAK